MKRVQSGDRLILHREEDALPDLEVIVERSYGWGEAIGVQTDEGEAVILVQPDGAWWWVRQPESPTDFLGGTQ